MTYVVINFSDITEAIVADCQQTGMSTLRHSVSGTDRVVLKYNGDAPTWVATLGLTEQTHTEILSTLGGADWTEESSVGG